MEILTEFGVKLFNQIGLLAFVACFFVLLIAIQFITLLRSIYLLKESGTYQDIGAFLNEYWSWSHVRENLLLLSLWLTSLTSFFVVLFASLSLEDISFSAAVRNYMPVLVYVLLGLLLLLVHTFLRSRDQLKTTRESIAHLKKIRIYRSFKNALGRFRLSPYRNTSWGGWIDVAANATEWVSDHFVKKRIDSEMKQAILRFTVYAALEYLYRMSIVGSAIWIVYHQSI